MPQTMTIYRNKSMTWGEAMDLGFEEGKKFFELCDDHAETLLDISVSCSKVDLITPSVIITVTLDEDKFRQVSHNEDEDYEDEDDYFSPNQVASLVRELAGLQPPF